MSFLRVFMWRRKIKSYKNVLTHRTTSDIIKASKERNKTFLVIETKNSKRSRRTNRETENQIKKEKEKNKMAKNWMAYEAAEAIMGNNVEEIAEVGSRYPLFTRTVSMANSDYVLDLLKALPKVTARVIETGLKDINDVKTEVEEVEEEAQEEEKAPKKEAKTAGKAKQKKEEDEDETDEDDYENMTSKALYKLCCDRGISSQCKKRDKASLIAVLKANDGAAKEDEADDWDDEEEETDPYAGKSAKELFKMCSDRGIKTKPKQSADAYVKLLKKADEAEAETEDEDDEDDDWEI